MLIWADPQRLELTDEEQSKLWAQYTRALDAEPFGLEDLPGFFRRQFTSVEGSRYEGYVTFIYPKVSLWDSRDLLRFADEVEVIEDGEPQDIETFAEIRRDRRFDDRPVRFCHEATHAGQLANLLGRATGARLGHQRACIG